MPDPAPSVPRLAVAQPWEQPPPPLAPPTPHTFPLTPPADESAFPASILVPLLAIKTRRIPGRGNSAGRTSGATKGRGTHPAGAPRARPQGRGTLRLASAERRQKSALLNHIVA